MRHRGQVITNADFVEVFEPLIQELIDANDFEDKNREGTNHSGAIGEVAAEAACYLGDVADESVARRIFSIRDREFKTVNASLADALLMTFNTTCRDQDLPVVCDTETGSREMVDGYNFAQELGMTHMEERILAKKLLRFCKGYIAVCAHEDWGDVVETLLPKKKKDEAIAA